MTGTSFHQRPATPRNAISFARRNYQSAKAVGSFLPSLTTKALQRYGFSALSLITDWSAIIGGELAQCTAPERIKWPRCAGQDEDEEAGTSSKRTGAVLVLRVEAAKALDVQYRAHLIIQRINAYFGYAAIAQLRLVQAPVPMTQLAPAAQPRRKRGTQTELPPREVANIADPGLRDALARLGAEIRAAR